MYIDYERVLAVMAAVGIMTGAGDYSSYSGNATWFYPGLSASPSSDLIATLPALKYNSGKHHHKHVDVHYNGKYVVATVVGECHRCGPNDISLSPSAFRKLAPLDKGTIKVSWEFK